MDFISIDKLFEVFFYWIGLDFITAVFVAFKNGKVESRKCGDGLFSSAGECIYLFILLLINKIFPEARLILQILLLGFIFKESISIIENLYKLGVWIPKWVKKSLEVCVEKIDLMEGKK